MKRKLLLFIALITSVFALFAQPINNKDSVIYKHSISQEEIEQTLRTGIIGIPIAPTAPPEGQIRPIAEWEPTEAVLIKYPLGIPMSLVKEMAEDVKVITIVASTSLQTQALSQYTSNGVNTENCEFLIANSDTHWTRDYGPWFMAIDNNRVAMYDFNYNRIKFYSSGGPRTLDNQINTHLANYLSNDIQIDRYASSLYLTGGNFMNDGILQSASSTLVLTENPEYTDEQIQAHYLEYLGIEPAHFIQDPIVPYDNIQHIDCWSKYLSPNKILIDSVPPSNPNFNKFEETVNYFKSQTSSWGMPYQIYRVFAPGAATYSGPVTPYSNSLILNKKVLVPVAGHTADAAALQVYRDAMPGYEVIGVNYNSWYNTDALHCRTHEIADRCMLYVKHQPYFADMENIGTINFSTELYSYCDHTIEQDSVIVYLRVDGGEYEAYHMEYSGDNVWEVNISGLPSGLIEYYIFAADESGRRECHPYIGAPDPHKFNLIGTPLVPVLRLDKTSSSVYCDAVTTIVEDSITVSNIGNANLTIEITDIDFNFTSHGASLMITPLEGTIQEDESLTLILSYTFGILVKIEEFELEGSFKIKSNDPSNSEVEIPLKAILERAGINELNDSEINIYPNPTTGELRMENGKWRMENLEVFDVYGRKVLNSQLLTLNSIDISHLNAGVYFVRITNDLGYSVIKKIIKL